MPYRLKEDFLSGSLRATGAQLHRCLIVEYRWESSLARCSPRGSGQADASRLTSLPLPQPTFMYHDRRIEQLDRLAS